MGRFDEHIDRKNTNSMNVEGFRSYIFKDRNIEFPFPDDEFIRMWVADMDFAVADEIIDAVKNRLIHGYWDIRQCMMIHITEPFLNGAEKDMNGVSIRNRCLYQKVLSVL